MTGLTKAAEAMRQIEKTFIKNLGYGTMSKEDLPLALKSDQPGGAGMGGASCPVDCDPKICDNKPVELTQCFKVDRSGEKKQHLCAPFINVKTLRCPDDYTRCAMVAPSKGKIYKVRPILRI